MQRIIKFRAWDGKMMIDRVWTWDKSSNHFEHYNELHENWMYGLGVENVTLMQFTGFKDKNGKEIYEGDVVASPTHRYNPKTRGHDIFDGYVGIGEVVFAERSFSVHAMGADEVIKMWGWLVKEKHLSDPLHKYHEVIGNIYENPELIGP